MLMVVAASSCNRDDVVTITLEDEHYRPATVASSPSWSRVVEYTPAPGQYIGDEEFAGFTGEELTAAVVLPRVDRRCELHADWHTPRGTQL